MNIHAETCVEERPRMQGIVFKITIPSPSCFRSVGLLDCQTFLKEFDKGSTLGLNPIKAGAQCCRTASHKMRADMLACKYCSQPPITFTFPATLKGSVAQSITLLSLGRPIVLVTSLTDVSQPPYVHRHPALPLVLCLVLLNAGHS